MLMMFIRWTARIGLVMARRRANMACFAAENLIFASFSYVDDSGGKIVKFVQLKTKFQRILPTSVVKRAIKLAPQ